LAQPLLRQHRTPHSPHLLALVLGKEGFNQNLETFAERVGLIVGLQSNGKMSQDQAYAQIRKLWKSLRASKDSLLTGTHDGTA
jgi:hypothetical protein